MNDAAAVCGCERVGDLQTDQERGLELEWTARDELADVLAFDELHRDEEDAVDFVQIEERADVWVVQRRREPRFAFEAFEVCFLSAQFRRNDFDHNRAAKLCVDSFIDCALPADTELVCDAVVAKSLAEHIFQPRMNAN